MKHILKSIFFSFLLLAGTILIATPDLHAQANDATNNPDIYTEIQSPQFSEIDSPIILSAKPQFDTEEYENIQFLWDFGDGNREAGKEVVHNYNSPGKYIVTLTTTADSLVYEYQKELFVGIKAAAFITNQQKHIKKVDTFLNLANESNVYLHLTESFTSQSEFLSEEVLAKKLLKQEETLIKLDTIIVWTQGSSGLNALSRVLQSIDDKNFLKNTTIILIEEDFTNLKRIKRQFNQLKPKEIIVIQEPAFYQFLDTPDITEFKIQLASKNRYNFEIVDQQNITLSKVQIFSYFLDFLTEKGIPDNTIVLILLLPVIATVIAFMKQVIGITTLGIYTPTIITLTFLVLGLEFGILLLITLITIGSLMHNLIKPLKLLYSPRMALVVTSVSIILFFFLTLTVYLDLFDIEFISLAIFPIVVMGTLSEKFVTLKSERGISRSVLLMIETFFVALVAYFVTGGAIDLYFVEIQWNFIRNLLLNFPEIIILCIGLNIYIGRWTGIKLTEYINYRHIINLDNSEE